MTSSFDYLGGLYYKIVDKDNPELILLLDAFQKEAVEQINRCAPNVLTWDKWDGFYATWMKEKIQKDPQNRERHLREGRLHFIDRAHDVLDHTDKYHLRVFSQGFVITLYRMYDVVVKDQYFGLSRIKERHVKPHRELWEAIVKAVEDGVLALNEYDKRSPFWRRIVEWDWPKRGGPRKRGSTSILDGPIKLDPEVKFNKEFVRQCIECWSSWPVNFFLRKNGQERETCPICNKRSMVLTAKKMPTPIILREDLLMVTRGAYPDRWCPRTSVEEMQGIHNPRIGLVAEHGSARLYISRGWETPKNGHYPYLSVERTMWMNATEEEIASMEYAVDFCPENARVFIAGLGLGIVLLKLAKSGKVREVIVAEIEKDVIELMEPRLREWCDEHYPDFNWRVAHGDAFELVSKFGRFDWIFFDIWMGAPPRKNEPSPNNARLEAEPYLTNRGVYTGWTEAVEEMKTVRREARIKELSGKNLINLRNSVSIMRKEEVTR